MRFCRQCHADLIGPPEALRCGTCGLPAAAPAPAPAARPGRKARKPDSRETRRGEAVSPPA